MNGLSNYGPIHICGSLVAQTVVYIPRHTTEEVTISLLPGEARMISGALVSLS